MVIQIAERGRALLFIDSWGVFDHPARHAGIALYRGYSRLSAAAKATIRAILPISAGIYALAYADIPQEAKAFAFVASVITGGCAAACSINRDFEQDEEQAHAAIPLHQYAPIGEPAPAEG